MQWRSKGASGKYIPGVLFATAGGALTHFTVDENRALKQKFRPKYCMPKNTLFF